MFKFSSLMLILGIVSTQKIGERQTSHFHHAIGHLKEIPKRFEVKSDNAAEIFKKYINDIEELATQDNLTIIYKVKVDVQKPNKKRNIMNRIIKKNKSKKYNIPLKKQSMKLSNFEVLLRKLAEENDLNSRKSEDNTPTTNKIPISSMRQIHLKFKPIISGVRANYTKIVKPVKDRFITLTV
ncbi:uncharacterized protein LOC113513866 [Galleria mellonella]|uniref:Uncharacterized protein LOC113513866 n=1 Tax=Galleria mellonella TaxID=7137 RepID=A0ABM3MSW5_GALME|nr:uncharacterized protein LOC113513866 [Galleria mellonella]